MMGSAWLQEPAGHPRLRRSTHPRLPLVVRQIPHRLPCQPRRVRPDHLAEQEADAAGQSNTSGVGAGLTSGDAEIDVPRWDRRYRRGYARPATPTSRPWQCRVSRPLAKDPVVTLPRITKRRAPLEGAAGGAPACRSPRNLTAGAVSTGTVGGRAGDAAGARAQRAATVRGLPRPSRRRQAAALILT
jgi:hypothetical protein